jgi:pentatricopeptide repeat protein
MYCILKQEDKVLNLFEEMFTLGLTPNNATYTHIFDYCADNFNLELGKQIHEHLYKDSTRPVSKELQTALINMYCKNGDLTTGVVLYKQLLNLNIKPDNRIYTCLLTTCGRLKNTELGKQLHEELILQKVVFDVELQTALIAMYCNFDEMTTAFMLYKQMDSIGITPSLYTYSHLIVACTKWTNIEIGTQLYQDIVHHNKLTMGPDLRQLFIKMFTKFNDLETVKLLRKMPFPPVSGR